ncbi:MAG: DUF305 domain-containing protein [Gemmatimonadetes bacterium]|nr:DUF305 domain-containing protein [Gemmatimonadota bacterium]
MPSIIRPSKGRLVAMFLLATSPLGACGGARTDAETDPRPATRRDVDLEELEALYNARADSARLDVHEADVTFMTGMIAHHAQALVMSRLASSHDASPAVRTLTGRIINAQNDEIAVMSRWLRERERHVPEIEIDGITLTIDGVDHAGSGHAMHMPGMLTLDQLRALDRARGAEFDRLFLELMIQHHNGAVAMVHELFAIDGAAQDDLTFKLASDIQVDQITEVARMERMLEALRSP